MPFNLFGKKEKAVSPEETIQKLKDSEDMLNKKSEYLEQQIEKSLKEAKMYGTKNKRQALQSLKKKKRFEQQLQQIDGTLTTIEFQREALQNARANAEILKTMQSGAKAMKTVHKDMDIDKVEDVMDEIEDQTAIAGEISDAISRPIAGYGMDADEDDLLAELEELEQEGLDEQLLDVGNEPVSNISLPTIPTHTPAVPKPAESLDDELAELAQWNAS